MLLREQLPVGEDRKRPVLYIHGATFPSANSVMFKFTGGSWADDLNTAGFSVWALNGVSALGLQRELGFGSYETAWMWLHKLRREMVRPGRDLPSGEVEVDETYVGGPQER